MVAFLQGVRKFPISVLTQPIAEMQPSAVDACGKSSNVNEPLYCPSNLVAKSRRSVLTPPIKPTMVKPQTV